MKTLLSLSFKMMYQAKKSTDMRRYRILMVMMLLFSFAVKGFGYTWTDPETGIEWYYSRSGTNATIKPNNKEQIVGNIVVPAQVAGYTVTGMGASAFADIETLTGIDLSQTSLTSMPSTCFLNCVNLKNVILPNTITSWTATGTFQGCTGLETFTFPENITLSYLGNYTFKGCTSLTTINIPKGIKKLGSSSTVGNGVFDGCTSLREINFDQDRTETLTIMGYTFNGCTALEELLLPGLISLNSNALAGISNLKKIEIKEGLTSVSTSMFANLTSLETIILPEGVTQINNSAFKNCSNLKAITIPASVTRIGSTTTATTAESYSIFYGCTALKSITFAEGSQLKTVGCFAFANCGIESIAFNSTQFTTFPYASNYKVFEGCTQLKSIDFSQTAIKTFQTGWFATNTGAAAVPLEEIYLPSTLTGTYASTNLIFANQGNLRRVYLDKENPTSPNFPANASSTFASLHDCTIYLPSAEAVAAFSGSSSNGWAAFEDDTKNNHFSELILAYTPVITFEPPTYEVAYTEEAVTSPALTITNDKGKVVTLDVTYASEDNTVAEVDATTGVLTLKGVGETTITASYAGNGLISAASGSYTLKVSKRAAGLAYSASSYEASLGITTPDLLPQLANPYQVAVTYSSSNPDVAEIAADGTVTLKAIGEADITATTEGSATEEGGSASYHLTVNAPTSGLSVSAETATLTYGASTEALPTFGNPNNLPLTYSSSDQTVATISSEGVVTLVGAGSTVISAHFAGNIVLPNAEELSYTLTVNRRAGALAFEGDSEILLYMDTEPAASVFPVLQNPNNVAVTYTSSDESVVTVDAASGAVTRVGVGTATITATAAETATDEASTARYSVTVYAEAVMYLVDEAGVEWKVKIEDADQMLLIPVDLTQETYTLYNKVTEKGTGHEYVVKGLKEGVFTGVNTVKTVDLSRVKNLVAAGCVFTGQTSIENIVLPTTVTFTNFGGRSAEPVTPFKGMTALKSINLPEGLTAIYKETFMDCSSLESITIPASVEQLGSYGTVHNSIFHNCLNLKSVTFAEGSKLTTLYKAFAYTGIETIQLPSSLTKLQGNYKIFEGCQQLKTIDLSATQITTIPSGAFSATTIPVEELILPNTLTTVVSGAFYGLTSMKRLELPEGFTTAVSYMLNGLDNLEVVSFPSTLKEIKGTVFSTANKNTVKQVAFAEGTYNDLSISGSYFTDLTALESIVLPDCKAITGWKFLTNCPKLTSVFLKCKPSVISFSESAGPSTTAYHFYGLKNCTFFIDDEETYQSFMDYTCTEEDGGWNGQHFWAQFDAANNEVGNHFEFPYQPGLYYEQEEMTAYVGQQNVAGLPVLNNHNLTDLALAYSSSNSEVAQVDATTGVITPVTVGDAIITATFEGDPAHMLLAETASYTLHVEQVAAGLAYSKSEVECLFGDEVEWPVLSNEYNFPVTYTSSDETVATVDGEGVVTFTGIGTTVITATCSTVTPVETAQYTLTVIKNNLQLSYPASEAAFLLSFSQPESLPQLNVSSFAKDKVVYTSSNPEVATVNAKGVVTALSVGEAVITASVPSSIGYDGGEASYTLTVTTDAGIAMYFNSLDELNNGEPTVYNPIYLSFSMPMINPFGVDLEYTSSDTSVLTLKAGDGQTDNTRFTVVCNKPGTAVITATFKGNDVLPAKSVTMSFDIKKMQYEAAFDKNEVTAYLDYAEASGQDKTTVYPVLNVTSEGVSDIQYSSSNTEVFVISSGGTTKVLRSVGTAIVTATLPETDYYEQATFSYTVHVEWEQHELVVGSTGYATYCSMSGLTFENRDDDLEAFVVSSFGDGNVKLVKVNHVMPKTPLLIKATPGTYTIEHDQNMKQYANLLKGTLEPTYVTPTEGIYTNMVLSKGEDGAVGFHTLKAAGEIGAWKAYLQVETEVAEAYSGFLGLSFEDETTGVNSVRELPSDGNWYTLQGVRIEKPTQPGIYVRNGKKVSLSWKDVENIKD